MDRKDIMAPIWRGIRIGFRKNVLPVMTMTMDCNSQKDNQGGMTVLRAAGDHQDRSMSITQQFPIEGQGE